MPRWRHGDTVELEYKGYKYMPEDMVEPEENVKIWHTVITPEGEEVHLDYSPYESPTMECFKMWVDMGMPKRGDSRIRHNGNFRNKDIKYLWETYYS